MIENNDQVTKLHPNSSLLDSIVQLRNNRLKHLLGLPEEIMLKTVFQRKDRTLLIYLSSTAK